MNTGLGRGWEKVSTNCGVGITRNCGVGNRYEWGLSKSSRNCGLGTICRYGWGWEFQQLAGLG